MSHPDNLIAVLDANVLYPQWLRDMMLTLAAMGYYEPRWSSQIIDEMRRNVLADHPNIDARRFEDTTIAAAHPAPSPRSAARTEPMDESSLPENRDADGDASVDHRRRERDAGLDELARISEEAGLFDDEVTATRLRR